MFSFQQFWFFWSGHTFWVYKIQSLWSHTSQKSGRLWVLSPCLLLLPKSLRYKPELLVFSQSLITLLFSTPHYYEQLNHSSHVIFLTSGRYYTSLFPLQPNSILNLEKKSPPPHTHRAEVCERRVSGYAGQCQRREWPCLTESRPWWLESSSGLHASRSTTEKREICSVFLHLWCSNSRAHKDRKKCIS